MNKKLRYGIVLLALVLLAPAFPRAVQADQLTNGTLNFTVTNGTPAPTGSFVWDNTTSTWNSFAVNWDGTTINFANPANFGVSGGCISSNCDTLSVVQRGGSWCAEGSAAPGIQNAPGGCIYQDFAFYGFTGLGPGNMSTTMPYPANLSPYLAYGTFTVSESTVPEPGSLALLAAGLLGLGFVMWRRKRRAPLA